ncbi:MAG: metallophosphoesterase [Evtepia sp.]
MLCLVCVLLAALGVGAVWGNRSLQVQEVAGTAPACLRLRGFRLAQVSDLHNAAFGRDNARLLAALAQAKPEIILLTGDLADSRRTNLAVALSFARQAAAIAPVYYVPGNHEARLAQYAAFAAALEAAGVLVLANRAPPLVRGSQRIPIAGLADPGLAQRAGDPRPAEAILGDALAALRLSSQPFPLLLAHRPEWFPLYAEGRGPGVQRPRPRRTGAPAWDRRPLRPGPGPLPPVRRRALPPGAGPDGGQPGAGQQPLPPAGRQPAGGGGGHPPPRPLSGRPVAAPCSAPAPAGTAARHTYSTAARRWSAPLGPPA